MRKGHEQEALVRVTIPAKMVAKESGIHWQESKTNDMRRMIDTAFGLALGRCDWENPIEITCRFDQFGLFTILLREAGRLNDLTQIAVEVITPTPPPQIHQFDQSDIRLASPRRGQY